MQHGVQAVANKDCRWADEDLEQEVANFHETCKKGGRYGQGNTRLHGQGHGHVGLGE